MSNPGGRAQAQRAAPDALETSSQRPARLLFVRHGQSTWNGERRIQGQLDPPLSALGEEQASCVAERLEGADLVGFYASDLQRCRDTAAPIAEKLAMRPVTLRTLREVDLGRWEGKTREELMREYPAEWERWTREPSWDIVPGGEGSEPFEKRVHRVVNRLFDKHASGDVLVVTHGGVIQVALGMVAGRGSNGLFPFLIENGSLTVLQRSGDRLLVTSVNDICHLS